MKKSIFLFFAAILCAMSANAACYLKGSFNDWSTANEMAVSGTTATCTIDLAGSTTFEFKVNNGSDWYGSSSTVKSTATTITLNGSSNAKITTTFNGTYTFSFNTSTKKLTVTYPTEDKPVETHDITVKAKYPATWTAGKAAIHFWGTGVASPGTPAAMTKDGDWWTYTVTGVPTTSPLSVIFINGSGWNGDNNQTVDITGVTENTCFEVSQSGGAKGTAVKADCETGEGEVIETHDITVKAFYPAAWNKGKAAIHFWGDGISGTTTPTAMTKDGDWWTYTVTGVPTTSELSVIFINGNTWGGDANQTVDITGIKESTCYQITSGSGKASAKVVDCASTPVVAEDVYTVVGSSAELGLAWDPAKEANDMEKQGDGSYKKVYSNVELTSDVEWKIAKNDNWWNDTPLENKAENGNSVLVIAKSGIYNVTFTLSADLKNAHAEAELLEETNTVADCYISGNAALTGGAGWAGDEYKMEYDVTTKTYSYTLTGLVTDKAYELKVVLGGAWYGFDELVAPAPANVSKGTDNAIAFKMAAAGDVVVTYNKDNGINLTGNFAEPVTYDYYIAGTLAGGWSATQQGMEKDGELYKATFTELNDGEYQFKITDGQFNSEGDNTHEHTTLGAAYEEVSYSDDGNIKIVTEEAINLTVIFNAATDKITFEGLTPYVAPLTYTVTVPAGTEKCYIAGNMNGWAFQEMESVTGETNKFTITIVGAKETDEYKYACQADWAYAEVIEGGGNRTKWSALDEVTAWNAPAEPAKCYLMGNGDWENGVEMEENPDNANEFILLCHNITESFKFKYGDTWTDAVENDGFPGVGWEDEDGDGLYNITLPEGCYSFYFKKDSKQVYIAECTPTTIDVTLSGMVKTPVSRMGRYSFLSLEDEAGNQLSIMNGSEEAYGEFEVSGYLAEYGVSVEGTGTWADVDGVETLTATLQACGAIYNVTATVGVATTITLECNDATYTITDPEYNEVTFTGVADGKEFSILVSYFDGEYYSEGEWGETFIMGTEVEFDDSDASEYSLSGTYIDDAGNTYEVLIFGAPAAEEPEVTEITLTEGDNSDALATEGVVTVTVERVFEKEHLYTIALPFTINNAASVFGIGTVVYNFANLAYDKTNEEYILGFTTVSKIEAGKPYLIEPGKDVSSFVAENVTLSPATSISQKVTVDKVEKTATMTAVLSKTTTGGSYWLAENRFLYNDNVNMPALRALFVLPTTPSGMPARARVALKEDAATGVEDLFTTDAPVKVIVNGQLIIIRDGEMYNVQGQLVK